MTDRFWSSEEYDERAHLLYNEGDYDGALETLKEGLALYPNAVDLYVGLGYARLAREEFAWARTAFERALVLDPGHEDGMVGMGEVLLRLGATEEALRLFRTVEALGFEDDVELMLTMGRALYREGIYPLARDIFARLAAARPDCADAVASVGYALHRMGDEVGAARHLRRALRSAPDLHEARIYLGHLLHDRGDGEGALREFERVPPPEHWDPLAVRRLMELKALVLRWPPEDPRLEPWKVRLEELEFWDDDPTERLLAEVEAQVLGRDPLWRLRDENQLELFGGGGDWTEDAAEVEVRLRGGKGLRGSWSGVVRQMRDEAGFGHEGLLHYMRRTAEGWHEQFGVEIPFSDPETFLRAAAAAGLLHIAEPD
jgi:tetratricopeptide (TPR) repeat protein